MRNCRLEQFVTDNYDFSLWVFAAGYTEFAALILVTWIIWPPKWPRLRYGKNL
jgi:hypothetical protein